MKFFLTLLFATILPAANAVVNVACGSNADTGYTGGARWTGAAISGQPAPYNAMRSSSPVGALFSYSFALQPGTYNVTLLMLEPRADQKAGQRLLNVSINGTSVVTALDLFAQVGALKPYRATFPVVIALPPTTINGIKLVFSASAGNAIVSGIQIEELPATIDRAVCEFLWGGGWTLSSGVYWSWGCENLSEHPQHIARVTCRSDVPGQILDVLAKNAAGAWKTLLVEPVLCAPGRAEASVLSGASYTDVLLVTLRVVDPTESAPSPSQVLVDISRQ